MCWPLSNSLEKLVLQPIELEFPKISQEKSNSYLLSSAFFMPGHFVSLILVNSNSVKGFSNRKGNEELNELNDLLMVRELFSVRAGI